MHLETDSIMRPANAIHPGEMLREEFLTPMELTQREFATRLGWTTAKLSELLTGKRGVTAESALDLAKVLKTTPKLWLTLQMHFDLHDAMVARRGRPKGSTVRSSSVSTKRSS